MSMQLTGSARLLYGAVAGAASFVAGAEYTNVVSAERPLQSAALRRDFDQRRSHLQHVLVPDAHEIGNDEISKEGSNVTDRMKNMGVPELIKYMDHNRFVFRDAAMQELLSRGLAVGKIDHKNPAYSKEQRMRLIEVEQNMQIIVDSERWKGSQFHLPEGWKPGEMRSAEEILIQLRRSGETGINIFNTPPSVLNACCSTPPEGTPFWEVYERIRRASLEKSSINTVSTGVLYLGNATAPEFTASDGALFGEMTKKSETSVAVSFFTEGTMQLKAWRCTGASAVYPSGTRIPLTIDEKDGNGDKMLHLDVPSASDEFGAPEIVISLVCTALPIRRKEVTNFNDGKSQETSDGGLRFLELRESDAVIPYKALHIVDTIDLREPKLKHGYFGYTYNDPISSVEAFDAKEALLPFVGDRVDKDTRRASQSYLERPASVVLRSIDLKAEARSQKMLRFPWVDLRDGSQK